MKKIAIGTLLVVICAGLLVVSCGAPEPAPAPPEPVSSPSAESQPSTAPEPAAEPAAPVYLMPLSIEADPGEEFEVEVNIDLEDRGISGGEIGLTFDSDTMEVVNIEAGDLLGSDPLVGLKEIDNQAGTVKYALARMGETSVPTPPGVLAVLTVRVLNSAGSGSYELKLRKVGLADEKFEDITGLRTQGAQIKISS